MAAVVSLGAGKLRYLEHLEPSNGLWHQWQVCYCGICKTDRSLAWSAKTEGLVLGREVVCRDRAGRYYALNNEVSCGECEYCVEMLSSHCRYINELGVTHHGGFASRIAAPSQSLYELHLTDPRLGIFAEPLACAMHAVQRMRKLLALQALAQPRVLIIGSGVAGKMIAHLMLNQTRSRLTICDIDPEAMFWAQEWPIERRQTPQPEHYHLVIECCGAKSAISDALSAVRRAGIIMIYGVPDAGLALPVKPAEIFDRELTLTASKAGCTQSTFIQALRYLERHQPFFTTLLGRRVPLPQLPEELLYHPPQPGTRSWVTTAANEGSQADAAGRGGQ